MSSLQLQRWKEASLRAAFWPVSQQQSIGLGKNYTEKRVESDDPTFTHGLER